MTAALLVLFTHALHDELLLRSSIGEQAMLTFSDLLTVFLRLHDSLIIVFSYSIFDIFKQLIKIRKVIVVSSIRLSLISNDNN